MVAVHAGSGHGRKMLLIGHLDTVFDLDSPFQRFERRGDIAEGPGVNDMKDGLSIMVAALRALPGVSVENRWVAEDEVGALLAWADALVLSSSST